jgi:hypothetical protein
VAKQSEESPPVAGVALVAVLAVIGGVVVLKLKVVKTTKGTYSEHFLVDSLPSRHAFSSQPLLACS